MGNALDHECHHGEAGVTDEGGGRGEVDEVSLFEISEGSQVIMHDMASAPLYGAGKVRALLRNRASVAHIQPSQHDAG